MNGAQIERQFQIAEFERNQLNSSRQEQLRSRPLQSTDYYSKVNWYSLVEPFAKVVTRSFNARKFQRREAAH